MLISASRRTDIPSYYTDWFFNRIREGFVFVRNPMNYHQVSKVSLSSDVVDGIIFWTKNPSPMLGRHDELKRYMFYFQFTVTPYGADIEPNIPLKNDVVLPMFRKLSEKIGANRVIWRYDPILISGKYTMEYHTKAFKKIAEALHGYTNKVILSVIDTDYRGVKGNLKELSLLGFSSAAQIELYSRIARIAHSYDLAIETCAEQIDLQQFGISHARCIDDRLFSQLTGFHLNLKKAKSQRLGCGCAESFDIGMYNTCLNGCLYCYANYSKGSIERNAAKHDPLSPLIVGGIGEGDKITEREAKSCIDAQMRI